MGLKSITKRSVEFVAQFQIEALCQCLRTMVVARAEPGPETRKVLKSLRDEFVARSSGKPTERIPEVTNETSVPDLLMIAELVRVTATAYLTPEEIRERRSIGFQSEDPAK